MLLFKTPYCFQCSVVREIIFPFLFVHVFLFNAHFYKYCYCYLVLRIHVHLLLVVSISTPFCSFDVNSSIIISKMSSELVVFFNERHGQPCTNIKYFIVHQLSTPALQMKYTALFSYKFSLTCSNCCAITGKSSIRNHRRRA